MRSLLPDGERRIIRARYTFIPFREYSRRFVAINLLHFTRSQPLIRKTIKMEEMEIPKRVGGERPSTVLRRIVRAAGKSRSESSWDGQTRRTPSCTNCSLLHFDIKQLVSPGGNVGLNDPASCFSRVLPDGQENSLRDQNHRKRTEYRGWPQEHEKMARQQAKVSQCHAETIGCGLVLLGYRSDYCPSLTVE